MMALEKVMRIRHSLRLVGLSGLILLLVACSGVKDDWRTAQAADTSEAYQRFIKQHADSEFSTQAQARIKQLADERDWQQAAALDTHDGYEQFVAQHADSTYAAEARVRIENFQQTAAAPDAVAASASAAAPSTAEPVAAGKPVAVTPATVAAKPAPAMKPIAKPTAKPAATPTKVASLGHGSQFAQLGAFSSKASAESEWKKLHARFAGDLGSLQPHYVAGKNGSQPVYRLQVGLASEKQVQELCARLKKRSQACIPVG
jgi:cell division septation protein DedD